MTFDWWRRDAGAAQVVDDIIARAMDTPDTDSQVKRPNILVALGFSHDAPTWSLSVGEAHRLMQQHLGCSVSDCDRKRAALQALVEAGKVTPDSGRAF